MNFSATPDPSELPELVYVCSVTPGDMGAGSVVMHRHLHAARRHFKVTLLAPRSSYFNVWGILRRLATVASYVGAQEFAERAHNWINGRWADDWLLDALIGRSQAVVVTIAHGDLPYAASRTARVTGLPLVVLFHDWWPDIVPLCATSRSKEDSRFRNLHNTSSASLAVCDGMRAALGPHSYARTLYPIPGRSDLTYPPPASEQTGPFRALYAGNLTDYGPMLESALQASMTVPQIRIEVSGRNSTWSPSFQKAMQDAGIWKGFMPRSELDEWLRTAHAFIITMDFNPQSRRRMQTSFPSKLTELSQYGRPLIIWGPEDSSAVRWARETEDALYVSSPCASDLLTQLLLLANHTDLQLELGRRARKAYETRFHPDILQRVFEESVMAALISSNCPSNTHQQPSSTL